MNLNERRETLDSNGFSKSKLVVVTDYGGWSEDAIFKD